MVLRTIDKLRAKLPGGKIGGYTIRGMNTALPGLSLVLLDGIGVSEGRLLEVVAGASVEDEVAQWLRQNANLSQTESLKCCVRATCPCRSVGALASLCNRQMISASHLRVD